MQIGRKGAKSVSDLVVESIDCAQRNDRHEFGDLDLRSGFSRFPQSVESGPAAGGKARWALTLVQIAVELGRVAESNPELVIDPSNQRKASVRNDGVNGCLRSCNERLGGWVDQARNRP